MSRPLLPRAGQTLPTHRQAEGSSESLTTATTMYREMEMMYWLEKAEAESG